MRTITQLLTPELQGDGAAVQQEDSEVLRLQSSPSYLILKAVPTSDTTTVCNTSTGVPHLLFQPSFVAHCLIHFTRSHILLYEQHNILLLLGKSGLVSINSLKSSVHPA